MAAFLKKTELLFSTISNRDEALHVLKWSAVVLCLYFVFIVVITMDLYRSHPHMLVEDFLGTNTAVKSELLKQEIMFWSALLIFVVQIALVILMAKIQSRAIALLFFVYLIFALAYAMFGPYLKILAVMLDVLAVWCAIRAVETTFKLHGRFKLSPLSIDQKA